VTALCLHPLDLACSKLVAGREKDVEFVAAILSHSLLEPRALENHISFLPTAEQRERASQIFTIVRSKGNVHRA
jgi:hypothetical protein